MFYFVAVVVGNALMELKSSYNMSSGSILTVFCVLG